MKIIPKKRKYFPDFTIFDVIEKMQEMNIDEFLAYETIIVSGKEWYETRVILVSNYSIVKWENIDDNIAIISPDKIIGRGISVEYL